MTTRETATNGMGDTCPLCRVLAGKPLSIPPHPHLTLADSDPRANRFRCEKCDLWCIVDLTSDDRWMAPVPVLRGSGDSGVGRPGRVSAR